MFYGHWVHSAAHFKRFSVKVILKQLNIHGSGSDYDFKVVSLLKQLFDES